MSPLYLAALIAAARPTGPAFRTQVEPRVDPVFGNTASLKHSLDRFMKLASEMQGIADQFSNAVHETLAELSKLGLASQQDRAGLPEKKNKVCPVAVAEAYERARTAGAHYVSLGRELDLEMRQIRTAETYGDTVALTPDYRLKVETARRDHAELLRGLREMQVAFHDQLESELQYVGCPAASFVSGAIPVPDEEAERPSGSSTIADKPPQASSHAQPAASPGAPVASIVVDATHCSERSRMTVDGKEVGPVEGGRRTLVRIPEGPHDFCVLPASDQRTCDVAGTVRRAYVHDGWVLEVRCD
jgi:hypothetical protein